MNVWKLGYATMFSLALAAPACGGDSEEGGGSGGSNAGSTGKGGSSAGTSGGRAGSSSAGSSNAGRGGGSSAGTGSSSAGTGSSSAGTSGTGNEECNADTIIEDEMDMNELPSDCQAYADCVEPCLDSVSACYEEGGGCYDYVECAVEVCECDSACISSECPSPLEGECFTCAVSSLTCLSGCLDEAAECM